MAKREILKNLNDTINALKLGMIITLSSNNCIMNEPRYYRYNNGVEYSDDKVNWKKSNLELMDFTDEYAIIV